MAALVDEVMTVIHTLGLISCCPLKALSRKTAFKCVNGGDTNNGKSATEVTSH